MTQTRSFPLDVLSWPSRRNAGAERFPSCIAGFLVIAAAVLADAISNPFSVWPGFCGDWSPRMMGQMHPWLLPVIGGAMLATALLRRAEWRAELTGYAGACCGAVIVCASLCVSPPGLAQGSISLFAGMVIGRLIFQSIPPFTRHLLVRPTS